MGAIVFREFVEASSEINPEDIFIVIGFGGDKRIFAGSA
jgi:hypothetical protein